MKQPRWVRTYVESRCIQLKTLKVLVKTILLTCCSYACWDVGQQQNSSTAVGYGLASGWYPSCVQGSSPGAFGSSSFTLSFWCPMDGYACDVVRFSSEHGPIHFHRPYENGFHIGSLENLELFCDGFLVVQ